MYLLILFIPLLNFILLITFGRLLGRYIINLIFINLSVLLVSVIIIFYEIVLCNTICNIEICNWFSVNLAIINWTFLFDQLSVTMILLVIFISSLVHIYSLDYMSTDPHLIRFISYLSLFTFFMLLLITAGNFVQLFAGWEGVGLSSYLLINFWYTRIQANKAAIKAIIVNRFGDFGIYISVLITFFCFKSFDFGVVFSSVYFLTNSVIVIDLISFFLVLGAFGKSAQIGLHTWLPDAMEGPTPVSALIHAATMVTAGVFVILRCSPIIELSSHCLLLVSVVGASTALFAGTVALVQNDIKKIIAYSTCSQLGYMFFACGMSGYSTVLFHLFTHGFFKALLFLGAGSIIHAVFDEQDMRKMGGLIRRIPLTYLVVMIGSFALMGFPFAAGFYSKEAILGVAFTGVIVSSKFVTCLGLLAAMVTAFYSIRLIIHVFFLRPNYQNRNLFKSSESNSFMFPVLTLLGFITIFVGYLFKDLFTGLGSNFLTTSIFQFHSLSLIEAEFLPWYHKFSALFASIFGAAIAVTLYGNWEYYLILCDFLRGNWLALSAYRFLLKKWYFDLIYNTLVFILLGFFYRITFKLIDRGWVEIFGPLGITRLINRLSLVSSLFHVGFIYNYIFVIIFSTTLLISVNFLYITITPVLWIYLVIVVLLLL